MRRKLCFYRPARMKFTLSNIHYCLYFVIYTLAILDFIFNLKYGCLQISLLLHKPVYSVYAVWQAWPRCSRSRSSWRRSRSSWCPAPAQTCRSTIKHGQTTVKWVVLTTTRTYQLNRARERHHCHQNQPACSAPTSFFCERLFRPLRQHALHSAQRTQ